MIGVIAVLIFGRRLPEVAGQAMSHVARFRRTLDDLRRETGIDREFRDMRRQFDDASREATRMLEAEVNAVRTEPVIATVEDPNPTDDPSTTPTTESSASATEAERPQAPDRPTAG